MLETIREFALDRLDQSGHGSAARRAHALYFRALTEQAEAEYLGPFDADWLDLLEQEYPNIRAAIDWSLDAGETDVALALPGALWRFFYHRAHMAEGREFLRLALAATPTVAAPSPALARALFADASLAVWQGESASGRTHAEASVAMWRALGDKRGEAQALHTLGHTLVEHAAERDRYAESVIRFREVDDLCGQAWALHCLGNVTLLLGEVDAAQAIHTEALAIARRAESPGSISAALTGLGSVAVHRRDHARAYGLYLEGFELRRSTSDRAMTDQLNVLGRAALGMGDTDLASAHFRESLEMSHQQGTKWDAAFALAGLAEVAMSTANASHAARLYSASDALLEALGAKRSADDQAEHQRTIQAVNDALGEPVFQQASASGRAMSHDEAIAFALNEYQPRT
jgi:tetratricopeptide (TPR) repeat protein